MKPQKEEGDAGSKFLDLKVDLPVTVWKCQDLSATQILHEINFGVSRSSKRSIYGFLELFNLDFWSFLPFLNTEIYKNLNSKPTKFSKLLFLTF